MLEKKTPSYTVDVNVSSCIHYGKRCAWRFLRKLKIELLYDLAILLLDVHPDKTIIQKDACTPMFIAALFTKAKDMEPNVH